MDDGEMATICPQMLTQMGTMPRISSECVVTSSTDRQSVPCHRMRLKQLQLEQCVLRMANAPLDSDVSADRQSTRSRQVLKPIRRLRNDSTVAAPAAAVAAAAQTKMDEMKVSQYVVKCLTDFGMCVVDRYMGTAVGNRILSEVQNLETSGVFRDGQLMCESGDTKAIRGDKITWVERNSDHLKYIPLLIRQLDSLLDTLNGQIGTHRIKSRSKAMVACYPGHGRGYKRHVDNATQDGRCITCIYYLNKDWNAEIHGGLLRMFPVQFSEPVDVEPKFDRLLLFWSDHRNPHEVQPSFIDRFAITVWYFDEHERQQAKLRHWNQGNHELCCPKNENKFNPVSLSCGSLSRNTVCDNQNETR